MSFKKGTLDKEPLVGDGSDEGRRRPLSDDADDNEWERRLASGDLPEDFLKVTEPGGAAAAAAATGGAAGSVSPSGQPRPIPGTAVAGTSSAVGTLVDMGDNDFGGAPTPAPSATLDSSEAKKEAKRLEAEGDDGSSKEKKALTTEEQDHAMALALQEQLNMEEMEQEEQRQRLQMQTRMQSGATAAVLGGGGAFAVSLGPAPANALGRLTVTVLEARLAKNYGFLSRMSPYCRLRIGHCVTETQPVENGGVEPRWNMTFSCYLLRGVDHIDLEIYDRCMFRSDSMIAHGALRIPKEVTDNLMAVDEWWPLSGQEGHLKEGQIHLILSLQPVSGASVQLVPGQRLQQVRPTETHPVGGHSQDGTRRQQDGQPETGGVPRPAPPPKLTDEQLDEFCKMFPNIDKDVIVSVFQENRGSQEATVTSLLLLCNDDA